MALFELCAVKIDGVARRDFIREQLDFALCRAFDGNDLGPGYWPSAGRSSVR